MKERAKKAISIAFVALMIAVWLGHEFRVIPPLSEELRAAFSLPLRLVAAAVFSAFIFFPTLLTLSMPLGLLMTLLRVPEKHLGWIAIVISIAAASYLGYTVVFDTSVAADLLQDNDCRPTGPGIFSDC